LLELTETSPNNRPEPLSKELFKDYLMLSKFRLSVSVVGTTLIAYYLGCSMNGLPIEWLKFFGLALGGMMVVAASNGFNQVYEKDSDKLMSRTMKRPVADGRMSVNDALVFSFVCAIIGLFVLVLLVNGRAAFLSLVSIFIYTLAYTPMKRKSPFAVFVGAIPGALPPTIGWVAAVGNIDFIAILLFVIQFFWQFPHFWAIAWMLEDDYRKADYTLLPNYEGRTKRNAMQIVWYSVMLIVISMYPLTIEFGSVYALFVIIPAGAYLLYRALRLHRDLSIESARSLMFSTLIYMPAVLLSYLI
jgi:protoheme IX farnesyltransferase